MYQIDVGAYTGASPVDRRRPRLLRHLRQRGAGARPEGHARCCGATSIPIASFRSTRRPALVDGRVIVGGRDKMIRALDAATGKVGLDVRDARARRLVAGRRRRPRLHRVERQPALRARRRDRPRSSGSSTPAPRSPRRPPSPAARSSSARRMAASTPSVVKTIHSRSTQSLFPGALPAKTRKHEKP